MSYHFIGLGGIGMSALARILLEKGNQVKGSDQKPSELLKVLEQKGAKVHIGHDERHLGDAQTVVYSSAVKGDHVEFLAAKKKGLTMLHRADLLHQLMCDRIKLLVTGTHGKTTTSALLSHVLLEAKVDPSFVIGGLLLSTKSNARLGKSPYFVAEADESDGSFLKTKADFAIITNLSVDHLDFWGSEQRLFEAFQSFVDQTKELIWCSDSPYLQNLSMKGRSYGFLKGADFQIENFCQKEDGIVFDLGEYKQISVSLFGKHNALNASSVFLLALLLGIKEEVIRSCLQSFLGTARRLEFKKRCRGVELYDDYGHHPQELKATIAALKARVKEKRLVVIFEPHKYSRLRDQWEGFLEAFDFADFVVVTDVYRAGEKPIPGFDAQDFSEKLMRKKPDRIFFIPKEHITQKIASLLEPLDVVLTMGAGDLSLMGPSILDAYEKRGAFLNIALICGGKSEEREVSILSSQKIQEAIDLSYATVTPILIEKEGAFPMDLLHSCDIALPALHGPFGEDGMMAGFLETLSLPYVGCDYQVGALCMDKGWTKDVLASHQIPVVAYHALFEKEGRAGDFFEELEEKFAYPMWVKPSSLGSSIGVRSVSNREELLLAIDFAFEYQQKVLVEPEIVGRQIEFALMGNEYIDIALPSEIINHGEFVSFDKKYGPGAMQIQIPAFLTESEKKIGCALAEKIYRTLNCQGLARIDFFLDEKGQFWLNEVNTFPGFTETSAYPKMWEKTGLSLTKVVERLLACALHRQRKRRWQKTGA